MVVVCPKCKTRLKVDETRLSPEGSRFKCPKCATVLVVKKPAAAAAPRKALDSGLVLAAHANPIVLEQITDILSKNGFRVITSADGIDVMVKALKELPAYAVVEVALPKIYGFEVCKRLKSRPETKDMKVILIPAIHDRTKYRREPTSLYGADEYLEEHEISSGLMEKIAQLKSGKPAESAPGAAAEKSRPSPEAPSQQAAGAAAVKAPAPEKEQEASAPSTEDIERAKRLSRTILNDIYLYNSAKVEDAIRKNSFYEVFEAELREGKKLYDNRISQETRSKGDFYNDAIKDFILSKKK
ncbi:MAG: response regulator [Thermodesulfovibrionales bacterium]